MFFLSSSCSAKSRVDEALEEIVAFGIRNIELSGNLRLHEGWQEDIAFLKNKYDLNFLIHNYFPPPLTESFVLNLASNRTDIKNKTFKLISNAIRFMDDLAIPLYSIHSGHHINVIPKANNIAFELDNNSAFDKTAALKIFYENIEYFLPAFLKRGYKFAIENFFPFRFSKERDYSLMSRPDEILNFIKFSEKYDNLGLLLDLGHLNVAAHNFGFDAEAFAQKILSNYSDKIFELHLSENDGMADSHRVNKSNSWQFNVLKEHFQIIRYIPVVFEWHSNTNSKEEFLKGLEIVREQFENLIFANSGKKEVFAL